MLSPSRRGAFLLSAAGVLSFTGVSAILNLLVPYLFSGDVHTVVAEPERLREPANLIALVVVFAAALTALIAIGAYWLHRFFGPPYFGPRGAIRWILFGSLFALLVKIPDWILPDGWWLVKNILLFLSVFAAFFAARGLVPTKK